MALNFSVLILIFSGISCTDQKNDATLPGYDLSQPVKFNMPQRLFEISGIVFNSGDIGQVLAVQDEEGDLFHFALGDKDVKYTKFAGNGDYEDVAICKGRVIVLKSNGELHTFPINEINKSEVIYANKSKDLVPKAEYEGLAADEKTGLIYILTKESKAGQQNEAVGIYSFKLADDGSLQPDRTFSLPFKEIGSLAGEKKMKFRPSALTKNQSTGEWYILSSVNKLLLITDADFKIKALYPLKGANFNQPEGIAFDQQNNLYISNEGGDLSAGNILQFIYKEPDK